MSAKWPDVKEDEWDMDVAGPFFGGMEANREELMGKRPHWMLEMLGVHEDYQGQGKLLAEDTVSSLNYDESK